MKILLGADQYPEYINGAANFTARLAEGLADRDHQVTVIWPSDDGKARAYSDGGVSVHRLRSYRCPRANDLRLCDPWSSGPATAAILDLVQPDIVHVQSHIILGRSLAQAASRGSYPLVATNHFMPENIVGHIPLISRHPDALNRWAWRDLAKVYSQADLVTAPTPRAVELLEVSAGIISAESISCGIDIDRYWQASLNAATNVIPTVLYVGRLEAEKNIDELIRAFAGLPSTTPAHLEIIGMGSQEHQLRALVRRLGLDARVTLRGVVSDTELAAAYGSCDIFCIPGVAELQSLVTLEAMSAGKPIIAANAMALPHLVRPEHNGYLYDPGDIAGLTRHLAGLLAQPGLRRRMGQASRAMVSRHSLDATLDIFERQYGRILSASARPEAVPELERARRVLTLRGRSVRVRRLWPRLKDRIAA